MSNDVVLTALTGTITSGDAPNDITGHNLTLTSYVGIGTEDNPLMIDVLLLTTIGADPYVKATNNLMITSLITSDFIDLVVRGSIFDDDDAGAVDIVSAGNMTLTSLSGVIGTAANPLEVQAGGILSVVAGGKEGVLAVVINGTTSDGLIHVLSVPTGLVLFNNRVFAGSNQQMSEFYQAMSVADMEFAQPPADMFSFTGWPPFFYLNPNDLLNFAN